MHRSILSAFLTLTLLAGPGCGDDSGGGDGSDTEGSASGPSAEGGNAAVDCQARCEDKAQMCSAPADVAASECQSICGSSLTEDQLVCLEGETCEMLGGILLGVADVCGIGGGSGSASAGSASGGSSGGGSGTPDGDIGDACECSNPDADFESCSGTNGPCGDLTCYVVFGDGICSQPCTADIDGDDCPVGECTEQIVNGVTVGTWCVP